MADMTRRNFLALTGAATLAAEAASLRVIGAQLYTVRDVLLEKPLETLREIEAIGYREVEVTYANLDRIWPSLKRTSLRPVSLHLETPMFTRERARLMPAIDDAKKRGFEYVLCPYIDPADRGGVEVIRKLAATLNKAGEKCRSAGLGFCYHNHAFEFEPVGNKTLFDVLMENTDPKLVGIEFDIMWSMVAGVDPVFVLQKYGKRIPLMHLKNVKPGIPKQYKEGLAPEAFREVGDGSINVPAVLKAAAPHVKHYFVEQDQTPGPPIVSLRKSYSYLRNLQF